MTTTAFAVYQQSLARGLRFRLVAPATVAVDGPASVLAEMDAAIDEHAEDLVAIVEEFTVESFPVAAALAILQDPAAAPRIKRTRTRRKTTG